jgi:Na+/proline symporter
VNSVLIGVIVYIVVQLLVGLLASRHIRSESDYLIAGRSIGLGLATFSMFATWFGAETCIGAAGKFYEQGLAGGATDPFGYAIALFVMGVFFATALWKRGLTTLADLFRERYSRGVERFAALLMAPTSIFWAAAQIRAFGQVMHSASELSVTVSITVAAVAVILYTCTGGLLADVMTDLVQSIGIVVGLGALVYVLLNSPEFHPVDAWRNLDDSRLRILGTNDSSFWSVADLWLMTICGSLVAQEVVARILGTRSAAVGRNSTLLGGGLYLLVGLVPAFLGLIGPQLMPGLTNPEHLLPDLAEKFLPGFLYILFIGALVSAILSTVDSTLLAASALVSHNFIVSLRPGMSDRGRLLLARAGVVVFGLVAYALALGAESIFELVQQANGVGSAGILVVMIFGLFTKFGGMWASHVTLIVGFSTWALGTYVTKWEATYVVSLISATVAYVATATLERFFRSAARTASAMENP